MMSPHYDMDLEEEATDDIAPWIAVDVKGNKKKNQENQKPSQSHKTS